MIEFPLIIWETTPECKKALAFQTSQDGVANVSYTPTPEEMEELAKIWVLRDQVQVPHPAYRLDVSDEAPFIGMVNMRLVVDPRGSYHTWNVPEMIHFRAHLALAQRNFTLFARRVDLPEERGIHIQARGENGLVTEAVWPTKISELDLFGLARQLSGQFRKAS